MCAMYRYIRKIDELGRIMNAKEYWKLLGIHVGEPVEVVLDTESGSMTVHKITASCICCGEINNLRILKENTYLCTGCIQRMNESISVEIPSNYLREGKL